MKKYLQVSIILTTLIFTFAFESNSQVLEWSESNGGYGTGISVNPNGDSYITGSFGGSASFGNITLTNWEYGSSRNAFIAKYDSAGNCTWAKPILGLNLIQGNGISHDSKDNVYLTGRFGDSISFGNIQYITTGNGNFFIAKYDSSGNLIWAKIDSVIFNSIAYGNGIAVDSKGNSYVIGTFSGTVKFGDTQLTTPNIDIFIAKYDSSGNCIWARKDSSSASSYGYGVSVDGFGNIYITGKFNGTDIFGNYTLTAGNPVSDAFVAKYDSSGNCIWAKQISSNNPVSGQGVAVDENGISYSTGSFSGTVSIGSIQLTASGSVDGYAVKFDANGNCIWAQHDSGSTGGTGIALDAKENVYMTGPNVIKYDSSGNFIWLKQISGAQGVGVDVHGSSYIIGDGFVSKLSSATFLNITSPTGNENWQTGTTHNITWNSFDDGNIKIDLSTDNGNGWLTIANNVLAILGDYNFTIPPFSTSSNCRVRLTSLTYGNITTSPNTFTISTASVPNLTVIYPNASVIIKAGSMKNIKWLLTGSIANVKLEYTTDNGNSWEIITSSTSAAAQSYLWAVPNALSSSCRVKISDAANPSLNDVSDTLFTIGSLIISSPAGGEIWEGGSTQNINWTNNGLKYVNLYFSTDNGLNWNPIITNIAATYDTYSWTIPGNISSKDCRIKIENHFDTTFNTESPSTFIIWHPVTASLIPSLGNTTLNFAGTNLKFSAFIITADTIKVTYYEFLSPTSSTLPEGIDSVSKYYWDIYSPSISFIDGIVSVPINLLTGVTDSTKLVWLKRTNPGDPWVNIVGTISNDSLISASQFNSFSEFAIGYTSKVMAIDKIKAIPSKFELYQNYPNPFNPSTIISYQIPAFSKVTLKIYDIIGNEVATLVNGEKPEGTYEVIFNAKALSSGVYFYQIRAIPRRGRSAGNFISTKKLLIIK